MTYQPGEGHCPTCHATWGAITAYTCDGPPDAPHPRVRTVPGPPPNESLDLMRWQDECLIAITDGRPVPSRALAALPPWRAVLFARVAAKAQIPLENGTLDQLVDEARRVGGDGTLVWPPTP